MRTSEAPLARRALSLLGALALGACGRDPAPEPLRILGFRQHLEEGVFLDEALVLHLSEPLDRASVNHETVRILAPDGSAARGSLEVERGTVRFVPELPRDPSLFDGGLRPGTTYTALVLGFPLPDGVRSAGGRPLESTFRSRFRTVERGAGVFDAPPPPEPPPLALLGTEIGPLDPILLECGAAIDPQSLRPPPFRLERYVGEGDEARLERLPLRVRLRANERDRAVVELRPLDPRSGLLRALEPGEIFLWSDPSEGLRTLSGARPLPRWASPTGSLARLAVRAARRGGVVLDFEDDDLGSPERVAGSHGTAAWGGGRAEIRLPAAVGDGSAGEVLLSGPLPAGDVHAAHLTVPGGARAELPAEGLVVLRSQTALVIEGELVRPPPPEPAPPLEAAGEDLGAWLARAAERDPPWTVLVAGGDVVVPGRVDVGGPLLVVAGGWIRAGGAVRATEVAKPLWILAPHGGASEGGAEPGAADPAERRTARTRGGGNVLPEPVALPFALVPPEANPLAAPLRVGALSSPIRPPRGVTAWRPARARGRAGGGSFRVLFLGEKRVSPATVEVFGPVEDVLLLGECEALRVQVELEMPPASVSPDWDPPSVERVELEWEEPPLDSSPEGGRG